MEWVETTGRTLDEAKEAALDELGVDEHDAEFEVITEPKLGLFGRVRTEGRVRARVRPSIPRAKDDRRDRRRRSGRSGESRSRATADTTTAGRVDPSTATSAADDAPSPAAGPDGRADQDTADGSEPPRRRTRSRRRPAADATSADPSEAQDPTAAGAEGAGAPPAAGSTTTDRSDGGRPSAGRRNPSRGRQPAETAAAPAAATTDTGGAATPNDAAEAPARRRRRAEEEEPTVDVALDEQGQVAKEFLTGLLDGFGLTATIAVEQPDEDTVELNLTGEELGLLIGPKGATLTAIQELTRAAVQRRTGAGNGRLHVDVSGYRQKRNEALGRFAQKMAADAIAAGTRLALEPMSAADRKVVHDALTEVDGVDTTSEGEDPNRHVVIVPTAAD